MKGMPPLSSKKVSFSALFFFLGILFLQEVLCFLQNTSPSRHQSFALNYQRPFSQLDNSVECCHLLGKGPDGDFKELILLEENDQKDLRDGSCSRREMLQTSVSLPMLALGLIVLPEKGNAEAVAIDKSQFSGGQGTSKVDFQKILAKASKRAIGGGVSGASAAVVQVFSLMWLRTTMNYQYRYGTSTNEALNKLYTEGGIPRFYQGLPFALIQGPLSRFGDTAANAGVLSLLDAFAATQGYPIALKTAIASGAASIWRIFLMPVDTLKTTLQVQGPEGLPQIKSKVKENGFGSLYEGALAVCAASFVGNYPWFITYNYLAEALPPVDPQSLGLVLARNAFIGMSASCVSDCCSNSIRVVKTTKQTSETQIGYVEAFKQVIDEDGFGGLFGRGLQTRILTNMLQGALFSVVWKYFEKIFVSQ